MAGRVDPWEYASVKIHTRVQCAGQRRASREKRPSLLQDLGVVNAGRLFSEAFQMECRPKQLGSWASGVVERNAHLDVEGLQRACVP